MAYIAKLSGNIEKGLPVENMLIKLSRSANSIIDLLAGRKGQDVIKDELGELMGNRFFRRQHYSEHLLDTTITRTKKQFMSRLFSKGPLLIAGATGVVTLAFATAENYVGNLKV